MSRPTDVAVAQAQTDRAMLKSRADSLRASGHKELSQVYYRAYSEFVLPAFTGEENTRGLNLDVRR